MLLLNQFPPGFETEKNVIRYLSEKSIRWKPPSPHFTFNNEFILIPYCVQHFYMEFTRNLFLIRRSWNVYTFFTLDIYIYYCRKFTVSLLAKISVKVCSHRAKEKAKAQKMKRQSDEIKENITNIKANFRFCLVWTDSTYTFHYVHVCIFYICKTLVWVKRLATLWTSDSS